MRLKAHTLLSAVLVIALLLLTGPACGSMGSAALVGGGSGVGAVIGAVAAGPPGAVGGAALGGALSSAFVENDAAKARVKALEGKIYPNFLPQAPPTTPTPGLLGIAWWWWLIAVWVWLKKTHIWAVIFGNEPRWDAILRALGLRTHLTPVPQVKKKERP